MKGHAMLPSLVRVPTSTEFIFLLVFIYIEILCYVQDDGKLQAESDSGEFWVLFGGFAPIGKKVVTEDDVVLEASPAKLYRYL